MKLVVLIISLFLISCSGGGGGGSGDSSGGGSANPSPAKFSGVSAISSGYSHVCALKTNGTVFCWGNNFYGQLGRGGDQTKPGQVSLSLPAVQVATGDMHSCALLNDGTVECWGYNNSGQLGDGSTTDSQTSVSVSGISGATKLMAGGNTTCALVPGGGGGTSLHKCWGYGGYGVLGDGGTSNSTSPVLTSNFTYGSLSSISNYFACGLAGTVARCWGTVNYGELGNGSTSTSSYTPVDVSNLSSGMLDIDVGTHHACAVTSSRAVKCWGRNFYGELGNGTTTLSNTPVQATGLTSGYDKVSTGLGFSCGLSNSTKDVKCWGLNDVGQLGQGNTTDSLTPVPVNGLSEFNTIQISAGNAFVCALSSTGYIKCWGSNTSSGNLGDGTYTSKTSPVDVLQ